jgi:hypothetical protein
MKILHWLISFAYFIVTIRELLAYRKRLALGFTGNRIRVKEPGHS